MGGRVNRLGDSTCYHGNAGIASAFAALGHRKIKPGGILALVLPLSVANGLSWQGLREMLSSEYTDVTVLSIAANGREMSFSSDTGMAECLVVARQAQAGRITPGPGVLYVSPAQATGVLPRKLDSRQVAGRQPGQAHRGRAVWRNAPDGG